jgi:thioredoxin reductase (NADPH)
VLSEYLIREIGNASNVDVGFGIDVVGGEGAGRLEHLQLRDRVSGAAESVPVGRTCGCDLRR